MDLLDALDLACAEFRTRLTDVGPRGWEARTPCVEWDVRYLVAHVVGGNRFAVAVLSGSSARDALESVMSTPQLGSDPVADFDTSAADQRGSFRRGGALEGSCDHPAGRIRVDRFLAMRAFDVAVHAWDLAEALGADALLDEELCSAVLAGLSDLQGDPGFGIVPVGRATAGDDAQTRMLDLAGRTPEVATEV